MKNPSPRHSEVRAITRRDCLKLLAGAVGGVAVGGYFLSGLSAPRATLPVPTKPLPTVPVSISSFDREIDAAEQTVRAIDALGGFDKIVRPGDVVCLKPNFVSYRPDARGVLTDPRVIEGVIRAVIDCRGKPVVMEASCGGRYPTLKLAEKIGMLDICKKYDVEMVDLNADSEVVINVPDALVYDQLHLAKRPLECERIISIPVMKTHFCAGISLGMKNYIGMVSRNYYAGPRSYTRGKFHYAAQSILKHRKRVTQGRDHAAREGKRYPSESLSAAIVDLVSARPPDAVVISGLYGREGQAPSPGVLVDLSQRSGKFMVIAGYDCVATDSVGAAVMGQTPETAMINSLAASAGLGETDLEKIKVLGDSIAERNAKFKPAILSE